MSKYPLKCSPVTSHCPHFPFYLQSLFFDLFFFLSLSPPFSLRLFSLSYHYCDVTLLTNMFFFKELLYAQSSHSFIQKLFSLLYIFLHMCTNSSPLSRICRPAAANQSFNYVR